MSQAELAWLPQDNAFAVPAGEVQVWCVFLERLAGENANFSQLLSPDEHEKAGRYYFQGHRDNYIIRRGVLRTLLGRYGDVDPQQVRFVYGRWGKPALDPEHHPGIDLNFNVAHSRDIALLAFARQAELGVDIEYLRPLPDAEQIAARYFSEHEQLTLAGIAQDQKMAAFYNCWTRKEAYIKALGSGLSTSLDSFAVSIVPGEPARLLQVDDKPDETGRWAMDSWQPGPGTIAALVVEGGPFAFNQQNLPAGPPPR